MKELAAAGDLAALLDAFIKNPSAVSVKQMDSLVRWAVREAGKGSPRQFTRAIYREAMAFLGYVQMRLHAQAVRHLGDDEAASAGPRLLDQQLEKLLEPIERLMRLTQELGQSWATTARAWKLARGQGGKMSEERAWLDYIVSSGMMAQARALDAGARAKSAAGKSDRRRAGAANLDADSLDGKSND
jgi:hypothetical protein